MFIIPLSGMPYVGSIEGNSSAVVSAGGNVSEGNIGGNTGSSFIDTLKDSVNSVKQLETDSANASYNLAMGYTDDIEGTMLQSSKASTAIQLTTQVVTRAVNSYKEIMQMQI